MSIDLHPGIRNDATVPAEGGNGGSRLPDAELRKLLGVMPGEDFSEFEDRKLLGLGGMGAVYYGVESGLNRNVAIKVLRPQYRNRSDLTEAFIREARLTAKIDHPNIVPVHRIGVFNDGGVYFTMRCITGDTLDSILAGLNEDRGTYRKDYTLRRLIEIFLSACNGVAFAHSRGVMHGDLKPGNIMVGKYGEVLVMDWGLAYDVSGNVERDETLHKALMSEKGEDKSKDIGGTPAFMAPEHITGELTIPDRKSEVYALGAILYSILTLKRSPYSQADTQHKLARQIVSGHPELPRKAAPKFHVVPRELEAICLKAMEKDRSRRYNDVDELIQDIMNYLDGRPVKAYSPFFIYRMQKHIIRRPLIPAMILVFIVLSLFFYQWNTFSSSKDLNLHKEIVSGAVERGAVLSRMLKTQFRALKNNTRSFIRNQNSEHQLISTLINTINTYDLVLNNLDEMPSETAMADAKVAFSDLILTGNDLNTYSLANEIFYGFYYAEKVFVSDFISVIDRHRKLADIVVKKSPRLTELYRKLTCKEGRVRFPVQIPDWQLDIKDSFDKVVVSKFVPAAESELELLPGEYKFTFTGKDGSSFSFPVSIWRANTFICDLAFPAERIPENMAYIPGSSEQDGLAGFFISKREVSISDYVKFWKELPERFKDVRTLHYYCKDRRNFFPLWDKNGRISAPYRGDEPVFGISLDDARAYCRWMSNKTRRDVRLPSSDELRRSSYILTGNAGSGIDGIIEGKEIDLNRKHTGFRYVMDVKKR